MTGSFTLFNEEGERKYLTEKERWAFFEMVERDKDQERRLFCLVLFFTGCRISEALRLTPLRILAEENAIVFKTLKRRGKVVFRRIPVPPALMADLMRYVQRMERDERIFKFSRTTGWRLVKEKMDLAGIYGLRACPKGLRHAFATAHASVHSSEQLVQKWLGHARLKNTRIYYSFPTDEELRQAKLIWPGRFNRLRWFLSRARDQLSRWLW